MESNILKFPSPIAACVVNGLMSGLPLDEIPTETKYCLVYATKPVINQQTPIEWWTIASNYVLFGAIPHGIDQIENAVVGYHRHRTITLLSGPLDAYRHWRFIPSAS